MYVYTKTLNHIDKKTELFFFLVTNEDPSLTLLVVTLSEFLSSNLAC